jgi:hypothetical protein
MLISRAFQVVALAALPFASASCGADSVYASGHYQGYGSVCDLLLLPEGQYECFITNGMTAEGCMTVAGAGGSSGSWAMVDGVIWFTPVSETSDIVVRLADSSAALSDEGLVLTFEGAEYPMKRAELVAGDLLGFEYELK